MRQVALALVLCISSTIAVADERKITLAVDGMVCVVCASNVKMSLERIPGVVNVQVSLNNKTAVVVYDDTRTDVQALIGATARAGFPSTPKK